jgi:cysteine desulfurase family protein (TIGR01976 family)
MTYDVEAVRRHFPSLEEGAAHFDGPGGSQVPDVVGDAVRETLIGAISNRGATTASARRADATVLAARAAVADLLGAHAEGVVFGRSMTQLTYDFARTLAKQWSEGDEIVLSRLDHDANVRPWLQAAATRGVVPRWVDFDPRTGELDAASVAEQLSERTRLVAITAASNLIGSRPDVRVIAAMAHEAGAFIYVDGVHLTPHTSIDVTALEADFYACSPYKFLGPHCAVVVAPPALLEMLNPDKLLPSSNAVPERFELGTLPFELLAGTTAAIDFLSSIAGSSAPTRRQRLVDSMRAIEAHESALFESLCDRLIKVDGVVLYAPAASRTPTVLFSIDGIENAQTAARLAERGVNAPEGNFYALETSRRLGLADAGAVRAGLAPYTNQRDVDRLVEGVESIAAGRL